jgi:hypothetical protein
MLFVTTVIQHYSEYITQEAHEGLGDFKVGGQIITAVRYVC